MGYTIPHTERMWGLCGIRGITLTYMALTRMSDGDYLARPTPQVWGVMWDLRMTAIHWKTVIKEVMLGVLGLQINMLIINKRINIYMF